MFELCGFEIFVDPDDNNDDVQVCLSDTEVIQSPPGSHVSVCVNENPVSIIANDNCDMYECGDCVESGKTQNIDTDNSAIHFAGAMTNGEFTFCLLDVNICVNICSKLNIYLKPGTFPSSSHDGLLGSPCKNESVVADGNCFFRAISQAVTGSQKHHCKMRLAVCKELERNADKYKSILCSNYSSVSDYIVQSQMKYIHSWATEVEIQVTADCLGLNMYAFVSGHWLEYCTNKKCSSRCIYLENVFY